MDITARKQAEAELQDRAPIPAYGRDHSGRLLDVLPGHGETTYVSPSYEQFGVGLGRSCIAIQRSLWSPSIRRIGSG